MSADGSAPLDVLKDFLHSITTPEGLETLVRTGGYVVLCDEIPEPDQAGGERSSPSIPAGTRALISLAGPVANVLLAAFLVAGLAPFADLSYHSPISLSNDTWTPSMGQGLTAAPQRKSGTRPGDSKPNLVVIPAEIGQVSTGSPAEAAGLQQGDRIVAIDHKRVTGWADMARRIRRSPDRQVTLTIERDGRRLFVELVPRPTKYDDREIGWIGISASTESYERRVDILTAFVKGIREFAQLIRVMLSLIGELIRGETPPTSIINGPLAFISMVSEEVAAGVRHLRYLIAAFSFGMAIVNMLPIPLLDGGQFLFAVLEMVRRRPCSPRTLMIASHIGVGFVGALMLLATYNDLVWLFGGR